MTGTGRMTEATPYPFGEPERLDMHPRYALLRADRPVTRVKLPFGEQAWLATRHADVKMILSDPRFSREAGPERDEPRTTPQPIATGIMAMDPPDHSRLRRLIAKAFTARRVEAMRPETTAIADGLIDDMMASGPPADLVEQFANPLSVTVICRLLGIPAEDQPLFRMWSEAFVSTTTLSLATIQEYIGNLHAYMAQLIEQWRRVPTDDVIGALVQARDADNDRLTEQEMVELSAGLLVAGHESTISQIPNFVYVLLQHPGELALLRSAPELAPSAVEELMRFVPISDATAFARYATEDLDLGDTRIHAGDAVIASLSAANRDPAIFDDPDRLDLRRAANPQVGFGHGAHHCLGAQLARMELQVAVTRLLARMPNLALHIDEPDLQWKAGNVIKGLSAMPIRW